MGITHCEFARKKMSWANDRKLVFLEESVRYKKPKITYDRLTYFPHASSSTPLLVPEATMQPLISLDLPVIPGFKRRRCAWLTKVRQGSYDQYRLLDLSDDALMVIMRRLLPRNEILRGRDLAAYRDVANLAFTCRRLLNLFRMVRTAPIEVHGLFTQVKIDRSSEGQIRYPPVADIQFFRNLIGDSGTVLNKLSIPFLPAVHMTTLIQNLFSVCFHLGALHLADAGTLSPISGQLIAKSSTEHLAIFFPSSQTLKQLTLFENRWNPSWHCSMSGHAFEGPFFFSVANHGELTCRRHKRKMVVKLKDSNSVHGILETMYPLLVSHLSLLKCIESVVTKKEARFVISISDASDLESLLLEKVAASEGTAEPKESELRSLYVRSSKVIDLFLSSNLHRKQVVQKEVKGVHFVDIKITMEDRSSCGKLCKCLLELFDDENEVHKMQIPRDMVIFSRFPEVAGLLARLSGLKRIHFSEPVRTPNTSKCSHSLMEKEFLEHLPLFLCLLQKNCKSLETVTMGSCFPTFKFEKRNELRPWINQALQALTQLEDSSTNASMDGVRRVLLMWLKRINLER